MGKTLGGEMSLRTASALAEGLAEVLPLAKSLGQRLGDAPSLVIVFASTGYYLGDVVDPIKKLYPGATVLGSSTAGEFTERGESKKAIAMFAMAGELEVRGSMAFHLAQDVERAVASATGTLPRQMDGYPYKTALLFVDPLSGRSEQATELASRYFGQDVTLAGGASGDDLRMTETQLSLDYLVATNSMTLIVLYTKVPTGLGIAQGHRALSHPMRVTRSTGSIVYEVDGRPAWDAWVEATWGSAVGPDEWHRNLERHEVTRFLLTHEVGLRFGNEIRLRAPLTRGPAGELGFACGIREGTEICVAESSPQMLVDSALDAARQAKAALNGSAVSGALVFDGICRNLLLGHRSEEALSGISDELGHVPLAGFEAYGEIGGHAGMPPGFHNTSTVVLAFGT